MKIELTTKRLFRQKNGKTVEKPKGAVIDMDDLRASQYIKCGIGKKHESRNKG